MKECITTNNEGSSTSISIWALCLMETIRTRMSHEFVVTKTNSFFFFSVNWNRPNSPLSTADKSFSELSKPNALEQHYSS